MSSARAASVRGPGSRGDGWGRTAWLLAIGGLGLATGVLVYLTDRAGSRALLLPTIPSLAGMGLFGAIGRWWPSFVHPFAFSLFSAAALPARTASRYGACVAWSALNVAFEFGQHPLLSPPLAALLLGALSQTPLARPLAGYFLHGTFDPADIVAALLGGAVAAGVIHLLDRLET